eukprot:s2380_g7.t1
MAASDSESTVSGVDVFLDSQRTPSSSDAEAPGSIGRQARDETPGTSSVDRMEMGGALDAVLAQDQTGDQDDFGLHSMCSDQASSAYLHRRHQLDRPGTKHRGFRLTKKSEPLTLPRLASDPRLPESTQHLESEHFIEKGAIGGAMSEQLVSWAEPLKITPNHPDVVERNARYLARLYREAKVKEPPIMEWTFLANMMQESWKPSSTQYDSNREYGLNLPRYDRRIEQLGPSFASQRQKYCVGIIQTETGSFHSKYIDAIVEG